MNFRKEVRRQIVHISGSAVALLHIYLGRQIALATALGGLALGVILTLLYPRARAVKKLVDYFEREDSKPMRGALFYALGICLSFVFPPYLTPGVILIATFGDAFSTLVGLKFGRHPLPFAPEKTLEGSLAFLFTGFFASALVLPWKLALLGSFFGAIGEALGEGEEDNIAVPVMAGVAMKLGLCSGILG